MEIAEALNINPTALFEPDYRNPNSVMHTLFELENIYGLRYEKSGENYQLVFSQSDDCQNSDWLIEGIAAWTAKRKELQPDINNSTETITDKKRKIYTLESPLSLRFGRGHLETVCSYG